MKLVALKEGVVVAIEQNGSINLDVEHDHVINAPDDSVVDLGWTYTKPPFPESLAQWFYPMHPPANLVLEPVRIYEDDGDGNRILISETPQ